MVRTPFPARASSIAGSGLFSNPQTADRIEFLAGDFSVDVLGFAVISNHLHVVLRTRPDVVADWADVDVARRWWYLFPQRREHDGSASQPETHELAMLTADAVKLAEVRKRLANVSWLMRCLAEPIARQANREDVCTGRFWEGRFKCQPLLDESALAACMVYVDLNPIRAGLAKTPETSQFTAAYERIQAAEPVPLAPAIAAPPRVKKPVNKKLARHTKPQLTRPRGAFLSPLELAQTHAEETHSLAVGRASHRGCLSMDLPTYLQRLDWTGRQIRSDKRGVIPAELAPVLERLQVSGESWVGTVKNFGRMFRRAAGTPKSLAQEAARYGRRWLHGVSASREAFVG